MSGRNPSYDMSEVDLDAIVDRILRGKYEKHPVEPEEAMRTGIINYQACHSYVNNRWGTTLSRAGQTMRCNNLWKKLDPLICRAMQGDNPDIVWEIYGTPVGGRYAETICYATGSRNSAINWARTVFGWTLVPGSSITANIHGPGGPTRAAVANTQLIPVWQKKVRWHEEEAAKYLKNAENLRTFLDSIIGASDHMNRLAG